jgi:hypothetical protein
MADAMRQVLAATMRKVRFNCCALRSQAYLHSQIDLTT